MQEQSSTPQIEPNPQPNPQPSPQSQPQEPSRQDIKLSASRTEFRQYLTLALLSPFLVLLGSHLFFFLPAMVASLFLMNLIMVAVASVKKHIPFSLALFLFLQPYCIILFVCFFLPTILHPVPGAGMLFGVALFVVAGGLILFIVARCIYKFSRRDNWHRISWPSWLSSMAKLVMPIICVLYLLQRILATLLLIGLPLRPLLWLLLEIIFFIAFIVFALIIRFKYARTAVISEELSSNQSQPQIISSSVSQLEARRYLNVMLVSSAISLIATLCLKDAAYTSPLFLVAYSLGAWVFLAYPFLAISRSIKKNIPTGISLLFLLQPQLIFLSSLLLLYFQATESAKETALFFTMLSSWWWITISFVAIFLLVRWLPDLQKCESLRRIAYPDWFTRKHKLALSLITALHIVAIILCCIVPSLEAIKVSPLLSLLLLAVTAVSVVMINFVIASTAFPRPRS